MNTRRYTQWWRARTERERLAMQWGLAMLLFCVVWQWLVWPARHTWLYSEKMHAQLDQQMAQMQAMQQQWHALPSSNKPAVDISLQAFQSRLNAWGDNVKSRQTNTQFHVDFTDMSSQALVELLVSSQAHVRVSEAHWALDNGTSVNPRWRGQLVFDLPPQND
jgi:type II secretory pathway component PulM